MKTTPLTKSLAESGAEFGTVNGWERALYYKPESGFQEQHSFRFNNTFELVSEEVANVQSNVGIMEVSGFNRYEITGAGVHDWLDGIMCSRIPRRSGKVGLAYFLNHQGNVKGEATLANIGNDRVWFGSAAAAEYHDHDWLRENMPTNSEITIKSLTNSHTILVLAGPASRKVLQAAAPRTDWSATAFPWLACKNVFIGNAEALAMSVSFSGELAFELHIPNEQLNLAFDTLTNAGQPFGLKPFGLLATESMRLEKGYRHWKADLITEFDPIASGLERFVDFGKAFIGKAALQDKTKQRGRSAFVSLTLSCTDAPAHPGDSIVASGNVVGSVTSAAWGHRVSENIAMGFVEADILNDPKELGILNLGRVTPAELGPICRYDASNRLVRG